MEDKCRELLFNIFTQKIDFSEEVCSYSCSKCDLKEKGICGECGCALTDEDLFCKWWNTFIK